MTTTRFTKDHEWIRQEGEFGTVGITRYAQHQLGDVVFVELPNIGRELTRGKDAAVVESVKAASEIYAPVDGTVTEINPALEDAPARVNEDPEGAAWFFRMKIDDIEQLSQLMDEDSYKKFTGEG